MCAILLVLQGRGYVAIKINIRFFAMYVTRTLPKLKKKETTAMDCLQVARTKATSLEH